MSQAEFDEAVVQKIIESLSAKSEQKARDLAKEIDVEYKLVRNHLVQLESHGIVYRTGRTRGTRWWLG